MMYKDKNYEEDKNFMDKKCIDVGLNPIKSKVLVDNLNCYLSNLFVLYTKLHNFHWNVVGIGFYDLHKKLEEHYEFVSNELDKIAERILMLGYKPLASMHEYIKYATLNEAKSEDINGSTIAHVLINDYKEVICQLREGLELAKANNDEYTVVILSEALGFFEKNIWMFCAYINR